MEPVFGHNSKTNSGKAYVTAVSAEMAAQPIQRQTCGHQTTARVRKKNTTLVSEDSLK